MRAIQPALWLLIFGETFSKIHVIPTGNVPYLDYLAPGIMAQSALFIAIFYGIQIIWDRDAGILTKLMTTPTPRAALVTGKAFAQQFIQQNKPDVLFQVAGLTGNGMIDAACADALVLPSRSEGQLVFKS
jgi:ABC-2 type transport system permease protein